MEGREERKEGTWKEIEEKEDWRCRKRKRVDGRVIKEGLMMEGRGRE